MTATDVGVLLLRESRALLAQHDRVLAAITGQTAAGPATLRVGVPLELPGSLLPRALADLGTAFPQTRAEISHASTAAQLAALEAGALDLALARECPPGPGYDAVLVAEEPLGVLLSAGLAAERAGHGSVWLHQLADLEWAGFSRAESPAWHDQVTGTLRSHGIDVRDRPGQGGQGLIAEVKLAAVGADQAFALAPPGWAGTIPDAVTWCPLVGGPLIRRTWAVWADDSRRRDLAAFVAALDITAA